MPENNFPRRQSPAHWEVWSPEDTKMPLEPYFYSQITSTDGQIHFFILRQIIQNTITNTSWKAWAIPWECFRPNRGCVRPGCCIKGQITSHWPGHPEVETLLVLQPLKIPPYGQPGLHKVLSGKTENMEAGNYIHLHRSMRATGRKMPWEGKQ